ncbi:MAG: zinc ribbon domain-containing protein [Sandaracinaceae bacterium]
MAFSLPAVFIGLAGVMLVAAMAALFESLRTAFGGGGGLTAIDSDAVGERAALLEEKNTLLRAIKDIQFEREVGKISKEDFDRLDVAYRRRAKEVLRLLDQDLGTFLSKAEAMVESAAGVPASAKPAPKKKKGETKKDEPRERTIACPSCEAENAVDATFCKKCAARLAPLECPKCGTENDPDAKFCKSCATDLSGKPDTAGEEAAMSTGSDSESDSDSDSDSESDSRARIGGDEEE